MAASSAAVDAKVNGSVASIPNRTDATARAPASAAGRPILRGGIRDGGTIRFPKMEPVPRPEWASPIEVGVHARSFYSSLPEQPTRAVLETLRSDPRLLEFLKKHELGRLEFSGRLPDPRWHGSYFPPTGEIVINAFRGADTYGKEFYASALVSVSAAGRDLTEAMQRSLYHELGHKIIDTVGPEALHQVENLRRRGRAIPISQRARAGPEEYFCESLAAYRFEDSFADKDPEGYHMVEAILRTAWRK
jgi:hypothetical protein